MMKNLEEIAQKHGVSIETARTLQDGLRRSNGTQVQFNLPELGGMGQWMPTLMMIGRMNDHALKAKVDALCHDVAKFVTDSPEEESSQSPDAAESEKHTSESRSHWWPENLGSPSSVGGQNDFRYAYFADRNRLVIDSDGKVTVHDTKDYRISGFGQQQSSGDPGTLRLHTDHGDISLSDLPPVTE